MSLSAAERETTITIDDEEKVWHFYSSRRVDITRAKKNPHLTIIEEGVFDGTPFLRGTLPAGGVAIRRTTTGTIKRNASKPKGMPKAAGRCTGKKVDGSSCGAIALVGTDRCRRHPKT